MFLSCCIVYRCVLLFSFSRCRRHSVCQCLLLGRFFSVRLCSSTCIWGVDLILLRFCPHVVSRLCPCFLYWGFVLIFYIVFWGFILIFYTEALSSYSILSLCPHILYWGFVLIVLYWGYVSQFEALVLIVLGTCYFVCTTSLVCLQWYVCGSVCLYFLCRVTRCQYYLVWISIHIVYLLCLFFSLQSCNPLFWFTCSYINFNLWFCWLPCFDMCGHYSPVFIVMRHRNVFLYASLSRSHHYS